MGLRSGAAAGRRAIPAVEKVLQALGAIDLPRAAIVAATRRELMAIRAEGKRQTFETILLRVRTNLERRQISRIQAVINGTGIIIHTNLGRAPLAAEASAALAAIGANYNNLEYDLTGGERGSRGDYLEHTLALLCGGEAATVVNNCAAALVLMLRYFAARKPEVIISRGELIQIGGGFRIPDILETSGATLREVGTTNKTTLRDYASAIGHRTGLILKVHRSNFFMGGFVESSSVAEIAALARKKCVPFVEDLGSGALAREEKVQALANEPTPAESLKAGVQLVCFSGDKLFGGPQAGIIAGKARLVAALKREPFFRALRCDKLILAALQATTDLHLRSISRPGSDVRIPVLEMLQTSTESLHERANIIVAKLAGLPVMACVGVGKSQLGGGTSPKSVIPSVTVELTTARMAISDLAGRLRRANPPVIGYLAAGKFKVDLRTVFPRQDEELVRAVKSVCSASSENWPGR